MKIYETNVSYICCELSFLFKHITIIKKGVMINTAVLIFLIHGTGGYTWSFWPIITMLKLSGWTDITNISYNSTTQSLDDCIFEVADVIKTEQSRYPTDTKTVIIGQSLGGVIAMQMYTQTRVDFVISIVAPLRGARILNFAESHLPMWIQHKFRRPVYDDLMQLVQIPLRDPPHDYRTISANWPMTNFDGCVFIDETMLNKNKHYDLTFADHRLIFAGIRLPLLVNSLMSDWWRRINYNSTKFQK